MAEVQLARPAFLNGGFDCPVEGCGQRVTRHNIVKAHEFIGSDAPRSYEVRCPKCWTTHLVTITAA